MYVVGVGGGEGRGVLRGGGALLNFCVRGPHRDCTDTADPESR